MSKRCEHHNNYGTWKLDSDRRNERMNSWTRTQLKTNAKQVFQRNYWSCVGAAFIMGLLGSSGFSNFNFNLDYSDNHFSYNTNMFGGGIGEHSWEAALPVIGVFTALVAVLVGIIFLLLAIFVGTVLEVGGKRFFILNRTQNVSVGTVLDGFRSGHYGNIVLTLFLRDLYIFLWTLLFVVPGIVKAYEYLMVPYILAENPGMDRNQAFEISKRMMYGQKMETFLLDLSFFGWLLLAGITCGIVGIFYVSPYYEATMTELYAYNKIKAYNEGYIR